VYVFFLAFSLAASSQFLTVSLPLSVSRTLWPTLVIARVLSFEHMALAMKTPCAATTSNITAIIRCAGRRIRQDCVRARTQTHTHAPTFNPTHSPTPCRQFASGVHRAGRKDAADKAVKDSACTCIHLGSEEVGHPSALASGSLKLSAESSLSLS